MIYYVSGPVTVLEPGLAVVDCGGVGYQVTISANTANALSDKLGQKVKLFTYLAVREDGVELFGFRTREELVEAGAEHIVDNAEDMLNALL